MDFFFHNELNQDSFELVFSGDEFKHIKAMRIDKNQFIIITNGCGLSAKAIMKDFNKSFSTFEIIEFYYNLNERNSRLALALPILDNKERFEFAFEKAIELGITDFFPVHTKHTKISELNLPRLTKKAIAAIKQCGRTRIPEIKDILDLKSLILNEINNFKLIVFDFSGKKFIKEFSNMEQLIIIGPEGGFSDDELLLFDKYGISKYRLGNVRLRAETASIAGLSLVSI